MRRFSLLTFLLLILSGCGIGERHEFAGSSENWQVLYVVEVSNGDRQETTGTIEYIGDKPIPEAFDYEMVNVLTTLGGTGRPLIDGKAIIGNDRCENCRIIQEDDELEVEIMWNGQSDKFVLMTKEPQ